MKKLAIINGKIYLEREKFAEAVYCEDGFIKLVGTNEEVKAAAGEDCKFVDAKGGVVIPGFNDSHCHLVALGQRLNYCDVREAHSIDHMIELMKEYVAKYPERCTKFIHGEGFYEDTFTEGEKRFPNRYDLDKISTEVPIMINHASGHKIVVNSKVLELAGYDKPGFAPIPGGFIGTFPDGTPDGALAEKANGIAYPYFMGDTVEDYKRYFKTAEEYFLHYGITSVQPNDVGGPIQDTEGPYQAIMELKDAGDINIRYYLLMKADTPEQFEKELQPGGRFADRHEDLWFQLGGLKLLKDGTLGGRTATMRAGYADDPGNYGVEVIPQDVFEEFCRIAAKYGVQVGTHVIGDQAVQDAIDGYTKFDPTHQNPNRNILIHCQVTDMKQLEEIRDNHLVANVQPIFLHFDLHSMITRCKDELSATSYAFQTMEEMGIPVGYGTDAPVEDPNPFRGLYSAVTRKDLYGWPEEGWWPNECVDIYRAVDAYTIGSAYGEFKENVKGRIKPGFVADFAFPDKDLFTIDPMELKDVENTMTILGGEVVYEK